MNIAKQIGISSESISKRIKQLESKGIIQGYRAMIDVEKLGYHFFKADIRLSTYKNIKNIMEFCHQHPNIYQVNKTIGGETLEIEFHVQSVSDMKEIIEDIEKIFPNTIESYDYITILSEEKMVFVPKVTWFPSMSEAMAVILKVPFPLLGKKLVSIIYPQPALWLLGYPGYASSTSGRAPSTNTASPM